ncbi:MAG TPA: hypothetical protein PK765_03665 [bacterium]|nr:hypothetical protein [bacterium]
MRDALTLLEQYSTDSTLPTERVESFLSIVSIERLDMLIDALGSHDTTEIAGFVDFVSERSFSVKRVLEQLLERIAQRMRGANREAIVRLSRCFARVYRAYERCRSLVDPLAILSSGLYSCLDETITTAPERAISTTPVTPPTKHSKNSPRPGMDQLSESGHLIIEKS